MTADVASDVLGLDEEALGVPLVPDVGLLRRAILKSVSTSPEAFIASVDKLEREPWSYWLRELRFSTWAVVEHEDEVVGIAAAKPPRGKDTTYADPEKACFIESVWLDPSMRARSVGRHLVSYLIEERRRQGIQDFYLWVLDHNAPAIGLYEHMQFKLTYRSSPLPETQYRLAFDSDVIDDDEHARNEEDRKRDWEAFKLTYRLLSSPDGRGSVAR